MLRRLFLSIAVLLCFLPAVVSAAAIQAGDTLSGILSGHFDSAQINEINKQVKQAYPDFVLRQGMEYVWQGDTVVFDVASDKQLFIRKTGQSFALDLKTYPKEVIVTAVKGEVKSTLFDAVEEAGEDAALAVNLAEIFEWKIDFYRDTRPGDKFTLLVEKIFIRDKFVGYGKVFAADYTNAGKHYRALYYEDKKVSGYFTPEMDSLKRSFLRAPIKYGRITSRFTTNRFHPVLKQYRPHPAVDYGAPIGTPVMTTADGVVVEQGYRGGNGNYLKIRHANGFSTMYLHLSRFAKGQSKGSRVRQGQVVGYVGNTGYSSGPHLDYRIQRGGSYINPLAFVSPPSKLSKDKAKQFVSQTKMYAEMLNDTHTYLARRNGPELIR